MANAADMAQRESQGSSLGLGLVVAILSIVVLIFAWMSLGLAKVQSEEQGTVSVRQSILDSAKQCFAIEGAYPSSLEYLEENYGLTVNQDTYVIYYDSFAANLPPSVVVELR